jgi:sulfatase maturation enzyme AslB (radical SAM superfamily)
MGNQMSVPFDVIFISNGEQNAEENWKTLLSFFPAAKRVDKAPSIYDAFVSASKISDHELLLLVDADNIMLTGDLDLESEINAWRVQEVLRGDTVMLWHASNRVNTLVNSHGAIKMFSRKSLQNGFSGADVTMGMGLTIQSVMSVASIHAFDTDEYNTWKTAFREAAKLVYNKFFMSSTVHKVWCTESLGKFGFYSTEGAKAGERFARTSSEGALSLVNNQDWIRSEYDRWKKTAAIKPYCVAPWVNSHTTAHGERSVCCATTQYHAYESLGDWWQSKELREFRLKMLSNDPPIETCESCMKNTRSVSLVQQLNDRFPDILESAAALTDENGFTQLMPQEFEIKHINCNLKCRHCYDRSSSSIRASVKKVNLHPTLPLGPIYTKEFSMSKKVNDIDWMTAGSKVVHWTGGEPFLSPLIIPGLERLIKLRATNVKQVVITNAMFSKKQAKKVIDLLGQFDNITIIISVDGMGSIGEYARTGWKESTFIDNVRYLQKELPKACFVANYVLHAVSILGLYDTIKFCLDNDIKFQGQLIEGGSNYLNYNLVNLETFKTEFDRCLVLRDEHPNGKKSTINELIEVFYNHYSPRVFSVEEQDELEYACKLRGQSGVYEEIMKGKLNES